MDTLKVIHGPCPPIVAPLLEIIDHRVKKNIELSITTLFQWPINVQVQTSSTRQCELQKASIQLDSQLNNTGLIIWWNEEEI